MMDTLTDEILGGSSKNYAAWKGAHWDQICKKDQRTVQCLRRRHRGNVYAETARQKKLALIKQLKKRNADYALLVGSANALIAAQDLNELFKTRALAEKQPANEAALMEVCTKIEATFGHLSAIDTRESEHILKASQTLYALVYNTLVSIGEDVQKLKVKRSSVRVGTSVRVAEDTIGTVFLWTSHPHEYWVTIPQRWQNLSAQDADKIMTYGRFALVE